LTSRSRSTKSSLTQLRELQSTSTHTDSVAGHLTLRTAKTSTRVHSLVLTGNALTVARMEQVTVRTHQYTGAIVVQVKARLTLFDGHTLAVDDLEVFVGTFGAETSVSIASEAVVG